MKTSNAADTMKKYLTASGLVLAALLSSTLAFAQIDVDELMYDNSFDKIVKLYGQPQERVDDEGESGSYMWLTYEDFHTVIDRETNNIDGISFWTDGLCVLSAYVEGGIKVGDRASAYKDIDFSKLVTGSHYEPCGFVPLKVPYQVNHSGRWFYKCVLSKGKPYRIDFSVENDIIREIFVQYLDDEPAPSNYADEENMSAEDKHQVEL